MTTQQLTLELAIDQYWRNKQAGKYDFHRLSDGELVTFRAEVTRKVVEAEERERELFKYNAAIEKPDFVPPIRWRAITLKFVPLHHDKRPRPFDIIHKWELQMVKAEQTRRTKIVKVRQQTQRADNLQILRTWRFN